MTHTDAPFSSLVEPGSVRSIQHMAIVGAGTIGIAFAFVHDPWSVELVANVQAQRRAQLPLDQWEQRCAWRDRALMALVRHRKVHQEDQQLWRATHSNHSKKEETQ